jgi:hypothetical protein
MTMNALLLLVGSCVVAAGVATVVIIGLVVLLSRKPAAPKL